MTLDFESDEWRDDMLHQQRIAFLAAQTHEERRAIADVINLLRRGKERARERREAA